ncbi:MAG: Spy/CpxP family protein refolding chaperone [Deltaproteobacteria bacterium]|nr:Spy/CpxP family protein refolding chaperone [Deltaproteobacteria bacterium]
MKKISVTVLTVIFIVALATTALAAPWGKGKGNSDQRRGDWMRYSKDLNLTAEQTTSIKALRDAHQKDVKPLHDKMFAKRGDLRLLWLEKNPDQDKIMALQKEIRVIRDQIHDKATGLKFAVMKILTPEQKEKIQTSFRGQGRGPAAGFGSKGGAGGPCGKRFGDGPARGMRGNW